MLIVIGASVGGVEAVRTIAAGLPAGLEAAVLIVLHIGAHKSELPWLLNQSGPLRAIYPQNGSAMQAGCIYVAPPDHHMLVEPGHLRLTKGPRENWARPAIDPLFRSAAQAYGADVIGVILTGGLNDGTAGLFEVKRHGGIAVVQDPDDAVSPSMPRSALAHVPVDHCMKLAQLPDLLVRLVAARAGTPGADGTHPDRVRPDHPAPAGSAGPVPWTSAGRSAGQERKEKMTDYKHDQPVAITCPDCGGALRRKELGTLTQFACHIGHIYTAEVMVDAQLARVESFFEAALRSLGERGELCRQMAGKSRAAGNTALGGRWDTATQEAEARSVAIRQILNAEWTRPDPIEALAPAGD